MLAEQSAVVAKLRATWTTAGRIHNVGEVPGSPATPYLDVAVAGGTPRNYKVGSRHSSKFYRATVRAFGKNVAEVGFAFEKAEAALLDERIAAGYTPCRGEVATTPIRDPDGGGLLMIVRTYTFTRSA